MTPAVLAERVVLGAMLHGRAATMRAVGDLGASAFADPAHVAIYWRLLVDSVQPDADPDLVAALDDVGGTAYLDQLTVSGAPRNVPESLIADACGLLRRNWLERCRLDAEDVAARAQRPVEDNVVDLTAWSMRGAA